MHKIRFAVEKKTNNFFWAISVLLSDATKKNGSYTIFICGNCMKTIFSKKKRNLAFLSPDCFYLVQIAAETSSNFFSKIFEII